MNSGLQPVTMADMEEMTALFNYYVLHSVATYTERPVSVEVFEALMSFFPGYPALTVRVDSGTLAGFGLLRPYSQIAAFAGTAELTMFIRDGYTGMGYGSALLNALEAAASAMGIHSIVATVSSLNGPSLLFHRLRGFTEQGRLAGIGERNGRRFDVVFLQKALYTA
jgi:phosphinothricin acetyltransferase